MNKRRKQHVNQGNDIDPPRWPLKILRLFVKAEFLEEIEGDMEEIFRENVEQLSLRSARRLYAWEMLKLFRPILIRNLEGFRTLNQLPMFKNYFKVSLRGLVKNPLNSFINVFGLAIAIGICIFAYAFARWTYNTDQFHEHKNEVHLVTFFANRDGTLQQYGQTLRPLGEMMKGDFSNIRKVCRVEDRNIIVKYSDNVFHERIRYTDPEFLEMFTFPLKWGTSASLRDINSVILSEKMSVKYFGDENPIGKDIVVRFSEAEIKAFKVTGVAKEFPDAHTIEFNFLINFENFRTSHKDYDFGDWSEFVNATLIQVDDSTSLKTVQRGMEKYRIIQNEAVGEDWAISSFAFEPLATLHERSGKIKDDISLSSDSKIESIMFISVICIFMLALACFNYINIAITTATKRLKEIGVRKTIGASRGIVIVQFLTENIVVTFFALITGIILGTFVFIPWLENLNHFDMGFTLNDKNLWIYLPTVLLVTGIVSGIYPSIYVSGFQVIGILRGSVKFGTKNPLTKVFLGVQLVLACILITAGVLFTQNTAYMAKRSWGYNQRQALYVAVPDQAAFEKLNALVSQDPNVVSISGSEHHLGKNHTRTVLHMPNRQFEVDQLSVDANYFETMELQLIAGRLFRDQFESDKKTLVVNESLVKDMAPGNPLGKVFTIDSIQHEIIGVVRDFHSYSFFRKVNPTIFKVAEKGNYRYFSLRVREGTALETSRKLRANWAELYPEIPFDGGFQEDVWGNYFEQINIHANVWKAFAIIAVLLASLGLYGLITLNVAGRVKEFSIRKILGATMSNIAGNITSQYVLLFVTGLGIGAPLSYVLNKQLFDLIYHYHIPVTYNGVAISIAILILVLLATVASQLGKVLQSNPVNGLKVD
jgi:putative ABC transport system permease protein